MAGLSAHNFYELSSLILMALTWHLTLLLSDHEPTRLSITYDCWKADGAAGQQSRCFGREIPWGHRYNWYYKIHLINSVWCTTSDDAFPTSFLPQLLEETLWLISLKFWSSMDSITWAKIWLHLGLLGKPTIVNTLMNSPHALLCHKQVRNSEHSPSASQTGARWGFF